MVAFWPRVLVVGVCVCVCKKEQDFTKYEWSHFVLSPETHW